MNHAEWASRHTVAAAVADWLLDVDRVELGADDRAGGADLQAGRVHAVLADIGHHQPGRLSALRVELLDELDVTPIIRRERPSVVIRVARDRSGLAGVRLKIGRASC